MAVLGKAYIDVEARVDKLERQLADGVGDAMGKSEGPIKSAALKLGSVIGGALAVNAAKDFLMGAVDMASGLSESMSKVEVVFGDSAESIKRWAEDSAQSFGQSKQQALEAAGTYGNLFQAFGIQAKPAQEMSQALVELAADLASFNNTSIEEALQALQSGVSGETEPLKRYGVAINDVRLKEEALALGLISTTKDALSPAAKAQASYSLILKDTALAQGDFDRTSDGLANKQRIVAAEFANARAEIGQKLLPVMLELTQFASTALIPALLTVADVIGEGIAVAIEYLTPIVETLVAKFEQALPTLEDIAHVVGDVLAVAFETLVDVIPEVAAAVADVVHWFNENRDVAAALAIFVGSLAAAFGVYKTSVLVITAVTKAWAAVQTALNFVLSANPIGVAVVALAALAAGLYLAYQRSETFRNVVDKVLDVLKDVADVALEAGTVVKNVLVEAFNRLRPVMEQVGELFGNIIGVVQGFIDIISGVFTGDWDRVWQGMRDVVGNAVQAIIDWFIELPLTILGTLSPLGDLLLEAGGDLLQGMLDGIVAGASAVWDWLTALPGTILGYHADAASWLLQSGIDIITGLYNGIVDFFTGTVGPWFAAMPGEVVTFVGDVLSTLTQKGIDLLTGLYDGVVDFLAGTLGPWLVALPGEAVEFIGDVLGTLVQKGLDLLQGFLDGQVQGWSNIATWLAGIGGRAVSAVGGLLTTLFEKGKDIIRGLLNGIQAMWTDVVTYLRETPTRLANIFLNAEHWLLEAGKDLIRGLWNGITSMGTWLKDQISGFAGGIVDSFKSGFGILSPSKVMRDQVGEPISLGLADGVRRGAVDIDRAIEDVTESALDVAEGFELKFRDMGRSLGDGFGQGIGESVDRQLVDVTQRLDDFTQQTQQRIASIVPTTPVPTTDQPYGRGTTTTTTTTSTDAGRRAVQDVVDTTNVPQLAGFVGDISDKFIVSTIAPVVNVAVDATGATDPERVGSLTGSAVATVLTSRYLAVDVRSSR